MLVLAFYDVNTMCVENAENVTVYLTFYYIIKFQIIMFYLVIVAKRKRCYFAVLLHLFRFLFAGCQTLAITASPKF